MVSNHDLFEASGPVYLTSVDWTCPHHRRIVAASLVEGAYVLERDRQFNRNVFEVRAPAWWKYFHFELSEYLTDPEDSSIFGAIYRFSPQHTPSPYAPHVVAAFRGTLIKKESQSQDLKLDLDILNHNLHKSPRFHVAIETLLRITSSTRNVWLAGHSLGSAIATLVGKNLVRSGVYLEAYLFNPPFFAAPIERIKDKKVKNGLRVVGSVITAGLTMAIRGKGQSEEYFRTYSSWVPNLYVNRLDHISSEYVGYFEQRGKMEEIGAGNIGRLATQNSIRGLFMSAVGLECEPLHLLPSARVAVNVGHAPDFKTAHGIHQWWNPDLLLEFKEYNFGRR